MSSGYPAGRSCSNCHRWIPAGTASCAFCSPQTITSQVAAAVAPRDGNRCRRCNSPLDASQEFCANCGLATGRAASPIQNGPGSNAVDRYNPWAIASLVVALSLAVSVVPDVEYGRATHARGFISFVPTAAIGLVAAILGWVAFRKFKTSPTPLRGRIQAKIGIRLGLSGFVGGTVMTLLLPSFFASLPFPINNSTGTTTAPVSHTPTVVPFGRNENVSSTKSGLSTMQVLALRFPVRPIGPVPYPGFAFTYWAVELRVCAGPHGADFPAVALPFFNEVHSPHGDETIYTENDFNMNYPVMNLVDVKPNQCLTGYVESHTTSSAALRPYQIRIGLYYFSLIK